METKDNIETVPAVIVRNLCFSYQISTPILRDVNMKIPSASIYGLLGPSGCGKTTLLKCIVNTIIPQFGNVLCFGYKLPSKQIRIPGPAVGYMPQEISLYEDLKLGEFLRYFAKINLMSEPLLTEKLNEIIEILDLKEKIYSMIKNLSGGQKRRVSFAATLIHKPMLAILDEPTVGVDPILRHKIWNHLCLLSKRDKMTILITTHYIEEAGKANMIAFLRKGKIIAEDTPKALISLCNGNSLEEVFLHFCHKKQIEPKLEKNKCPAIMNNECLNEVKHESEVQRKASQTFSEWIKIFLTLYWKFHVRYIRHPEVIVFFFAFPLLVVIFSALCIGKSVFDVKIGFVNMEAPENFSLHFRDSIDDGYLIIREYETYPEAMRAAKRGEIWGFIYINEFFTDSLIARTNLDSDISNETVEESVIYVFADITNEAKTISISKHLTRYFRKFVKRTLQMYGMNPSLADSPIVIDEVIYGEESVDPLNREFLVCGILVLVTYVSNCSFIAAVLIVERDSNMFERHFVAGVTTTQIFTASFAHKLLTVAIQTMFLVFVVITVYDFEWHWNVCWAVVILFLAQVSGLSMGLLFSTAFDQLYNLAIVVTAFSLMTLCIGGVAWPLESIPYWMRWLSELQPTCLPSVGLRAVLMKKFGIQNQEVRSAIFLSLIYTVVCCLIGNKLFRYKK